ncbi:MAG: phosphate starvation-inducible protein PhoH [Armatimonadetes bacterium CG07_land_8_20_14_0_80_40_9]|nr:MAG: phosphate starvation-inducible protein PhoH [Armatimonadetes bacterium CG07_land_8_20_14_0_80_40_9]
MNSKDRFQVRGKVSIGDGKARDFLSSNEVLLSELEGEFGIKIVNRGNELQVIGGKVKVGKVKRLMGEVITLIEGGQALSLSEVRYALKIAKSEEVSLSSALPDVLLVTTRGKQIKAKTLGQKGYIEAMKEHDMVFVIGPAGTGKTYLAVAMAVLSLQEKQAHRIILTRPAVEAGEKLGYLPGDLQEKVSPYFRPLYDALFDMMDAEKFQKLLERGIIEIAPLAFMRGRTLNDAFIILDEAQNTTSEQMKMFLTRLGFSSRVVVTGDVTQIDLPQGRYSGLNEVRTILSGIKGIKFVYLNDQDVVRHELVQEVIKAYERYEARGQKAKESIVHSP